MPRPLPGILLTAVAARFREVMPSSVERKPLHLYAIANSGVPLASAILADRAFRQHSCEDDLLTILTPGQYQFVSGDIDRTLLPLLVDNSVNSGDTIAEIVDVMQSNNYPVNQLVTLVDYQDDPFVAQERQLRESLGINMIALFTVAEIGSGLLRVHRRTERRAEVA